MARKKIASSLSEITVGGGSLNAIDMHECPQCHRHSLLQTDTRFRCLSCSFYRNLAVSKRSQSEASEGNWMFVIAIAVVVLLLLLNS